MADLLGAAGLGVKAAIPYLKKSSQGRVIITSSITGPITGFPGWTHYGATKAGQLGFMRTACVAVSTVKPQPARKIPGCFST